MVVVRAAVLHGVGQPLQVHHLDLDPPRAGEVRVRLAAAGVCHSDLSVQAGTILSQFPVVLGHEGAGVVEEVGEGVAGLTPGDHVVVSWVPQCGSCFFCRRGQGFLCQQAEPALAGTLLDGTTRFSHEGRPTYQMMAAGTFAEAAVLPAAGLVKLPDDVPLTVAAPMGCGVLTGVGAALNTADIAPGDTVAVVGCGGVGLNVVQGARIAGAGRIVAVDTNPAKLALAEQLGATDTVDASQGDPVSAVMGLTEERGADVAFEAIGLEQTILQTVTMTRRGGQSVLVGIPPVHVMLQLPAFFGLVLAAKRITGCWYGSATTHRDVPRLVELYRTGELQLEPLVSQTIGLDEVNEAFAALTAGEVARSVIEYG